MYQQTVLYAHFNLLLNECILVFNREMRKFQ